MEEMGCCIGRLGIEKLDLMNVMEASMGEEEGSKSDKMVSIPSSLPYECTVPTGGRTSKGRMKWWKISEVIANGSDSELHLQVRPEFAEFLA